jgi:nicotinate dehydrogenase subunit A
LQQIQFVVNGENQVLDIEANTPLLYALRDNLGLLGTRFGCGQGSCGACTVIVDGKARTSCDMSVQEADGCQIETVEVLGPASDPRHPLARAAISEQAAQCGFCLPGILMAAKALLDVNPDPSDIEIRTALDGNLCRCGAHVRILRAILTAANERATI